RVADEERIEGCAFRTKEIGHLRVRGHQLVIAEDAVNEPDVHAPGMRQVARIDVERLVNPLVVDLEEPVPQPPADVGAELRDGYQCCPGYAAQHHYQVKDNAADAELQALAHLKRHHELQQVDHPRDLLETAHLAGEDRQAQQQSNTEQVAPAAYAALDE